MQHDDCGYRCWCGRLCFCLIDFRKRLCSGGAVRLSGVFPLRVSGETLVFEGFVLAMFGLAFCNA